MFKFKLKSFVSSVLVIAMLVSFVNLFETPTFAEEKEDNYATNCAIGAGIIQVDTFGSHYTVGQEITVQYTVISESEILNFGYYCDGVTVTGSNFSSENSIITLTFLCDNRSDISTLTLNVILEDQCSLTSKIYVYSNDYGHFVSHASEDNAKEKYFTYMKENGLMSDEECASLRNEMYSASVGGNLALTLVTDTDPMMNNDEYSLNAASTANTFVRGNLKWIDDDGNSHFARGVKIELYDKEPIGETLMATTTTTDQGAYYFGFENADSFWDFENGGYDIFLRIYITDGNVTVVNAENDNVYVLETEVYEDVATYSSLTFLTGKTLPDGSKDQIDMTSDYGRAMQIFQAAYTAKDYAKSMMGKNPDAVKIVYPSDEKNCCYYGGSKTIHILNSTTDEDQPNSYASWDVITHEYGHHIENQFKIHDISGYSSDYEHYFERDLGTQFGNKDYGIRCAWSESWATVFGLVSQQYFYSYSQIAYAQDSVFDSYNRYAGFELDDPFSGYRLGEASEGSITAVLWDLFDMGADEDYDTVELWCDDFWKVSTSNQHVTFSQFITYLYDLYPSDIYEIGAILSEHNILPEFKSSYCSASANKAQIVYNYPSISKIAYPCNKVYLCVYDKNMNLIDAVKLDMSKTSYVYEGEKWEYIKSLVGEELYVALEAYETSAPKTGVYYSNLLKILITG